MDAAIRNLHDECVRLMNHHVVLTMTDGQTLDGIIEAVDYDNMTVLVGEDVYEEGAERQFSYGGFDGYGRPRRRFRRFRRRRFPFPFFTAVALFPYVVPFQPYPYPYYPYY